MARDEASVSEKELLRALACGQAEAEETQPLCAIYPELGLTTSEDLPCLTLRRVPNERHIPADPRLLLPSVPPSRLTPGLGKDLQVAKQSSACSCPAPSLQRQRGEASGRPAVAPGVRLRFLPDLLCLSTLLCRQIPEGLRFCSSRMGAAESSATDRGESCLVMPLCLLGQLPPGLHWMTDDREAPEKKEFASVLSGKSLEERGAFKQAGRETHTKGSARQECRFQLCSG